MNPIKFIADKVRSILKLEPADRTTFVVKEQLDFSGTAFLNKLWYRGKGEELQQMYRQLYDRATNHFWGNTSTHGMEMVKLHTGIPKLMVNTLAGITARDFNGIAFDDTAQNELWNGAEGIAAENKIGNLMLDSVIDMLVVGDGAYKISIDRGLSDLPIIEWVSGENIELHHRRGRLTEVEFLTEYHDGKRRYCLHEYYGRGYVRYKLFDSDGAEVELKTLPQTAELSNVEFDGNYIMAVPLMLIGSKQFSGRGQSIFEGKLDNFDALDEAYSQWWQAMRSSRPRTYMPERLIPRDPRNGALIKPNPFDNQYIAVSSNMSEGAQDKVVVEQPQFPASDYCTSYITALDLALQGIVSPSTLGIDVKKLDNAEAQREKEKVTLYTRNLIISKLTEAWKLLCTAALNTYAAMNGNPLPQVSVTVTFGEYANPSFEAVVETLSNPSAPMSVESKVEELWGDSKDDSWKQEEVQRIKEQTGITTVDEPSFGGFGDDEMPSGDYLPAKPTETQEVTQTVQALNGAQTQSLIAIMSQCSSGAITEGQAVKLISTAIGIPTDEARKIITGEM